MKLKRTFLTIATLLGVATAVSFAGDPSTKTKTGKTAAKSKAKTEEAIPGADLQPAAYFYTGKPYDEDLGGYVFNYRTYSPGMNRWTTPDPSGFPDGANNCAYAPIPTVDYDAFGLQLPTATDMWNAYQPYDFAQRTAPQMFNLAGGDLAKDQASGNKDYQNSCAIRMTFALRADGYTINKSTPGIDAERGANGTPYFIKAVNAGTYLASQWGAANGAYTNLQATLNSMAQKTGRPAIAVVVSNSHVGIVTSSSIQYTDPHSNLWNANSQVWILE